jgi:hypothetical protein
MSKLSTQRVECPFPKDWRTWDIFRFWQLPPELQKLIDQGKAIKTKKVLSSLSINWILAPDSDPVSLSKNQDQRIHYHVDFEIDDKKIHWDAASGLFSGPLRGFFNSRIYVDSVLAGFGGSTGGFWGGSGYHPAVVLLGGKRALVEVHHGEITETSAEIVEY